jgi:type IV secretory pathway VirB10-like protein
MRRLAIRSALSGKVADGQLHVVDKLGVAQPRTKDVVSVLQNVGIERSALIVTGEPDRSVLDSARNLPKTKVLPAAYLNVVDMLTHRDLLLTEAAVRAVEGLWGRVAAKPAPAEEPKPRRRRAPVAEKPAAEAEAQPEPKPRRRRAAATPKATAAKDEAAAKPARRASRPRAGAEGEPKAAARRPATRRAKKEEG